MVLAGQYLERPTLIPRPLDGGGSLTLEGLYHRGDAAPGVVVCAPHPRLGGSMDSPVVAELAWALTRRGHATLRFNYQGVGASEGEMQAPRPGNAPLALSAIRSEIDDARAAVEQLAASTGHGRVAVAGYSFGAAVALGLALEGGPCTHLLLIAPPTKLFDFSGLSALTVPAWVAFGDADALVEGSVLERALQGRGTPLEVLPGSDHTFTRGLTELGARAATWLESTRR